ncbi:septal ring lytic transglycosylase RlpA family protein [Labrys portucalensis]|uniref:Endolytic peptidoglycan transglycosylase RlpA n=1 Tax=Labrys neptuniae TaxID=376174 RepID=A0ABV6ZA74_9HYPH
MAENLSAVPNCVELRISDTSSPSRVSGAVVKATVALVGCAALASCAAPNQAYAPKPATTQVAAATSTAIVPPPAGTRVAMPPVRSKNGTDKPYAVGGKRYVPASHDSKYTAVGLASWYGPGFNGRKTAVGERFDMTGLSAAHKTMPLPSYARVTNLTNGTSIVVRVNDRGPYVHGRLIDLSSRAADLLQFKGSGVGRVKVEYVGRAPESGSDNKMLLATLRTDGTPAPLPAGLPNTMVADAAPPTRPTATPILPVKAVTQVASATEAKPSRLAAPEIKPVMVPPVIAQADPMDPPVATTEVAGLTNMAFTPLPPSRPRSSDGVLGKVPTGSVGQVNLAKAKAPDASMEPSMAVQPTAQAFAATPAHGPAVLVPTPPVTASMAGQ